jgi:hypothetical protein
MFLSGIGVRVGMPRSAYFVAAMFEIVILFDGRGIGQTRRAWGTHQLFEIKG